MRNGGKLQGIPAKANKVSAHRISRDRWFPLHANCAKKLRSSSLRVIIDFFILEPAG
jgi:hypothetical protein